MPEWFTQPAATFFAAALAALFALLSLIANLFFQRGAEFRAAHRKALEPHLADLGESLHDVVAIATVILRRMQDEESITNWNDKAVEAQRKLDIVSKRVKYPLWGLQGGIRQLRRLSSWVSHQKKAPEGAIDILHAGEALRSSLDSAIRKSYRTGSPPSWLAVRRVERLSKTLTETYRKIMKQDLPDNDE